jgi:hypothetical protein
MTMSLRETVPFAAAAVVSAALVACQSAPESVPPNALVAAKVAQAPRLEAGAGDAAWNAARPLRFEVNGGVHFGGKGETQVTMKAVYSADMIYFLVQYADPTHSVRRGPCQKQADGSWLKLKDPALFLVFGK